MLTQNLSFGTGGADSVKCSRAGCHELATFQVVWRNPKIHTEERRKIWLACSEHRDFLVDYLSVRSFFIETLSLS
jgi:hypothetical protein